MTDSMAGLRQNFQKLLESLDYPAENINGMLRVAGRVTTVLDSITKSLEAAEKNPLLQKCLLFVETIANPFIEFVVNPEKGYVFVTNRIASVSSTIAQLIGLESDIPIEMRRRVEEIKDYFKKVKSVMSEVDDDATKMTAMVKSTLFYYYYYYFFFIIIVIIIVVVVDVVSFLGFQRVSPSLHPTSNSFPIANCVYVMVQFYPRFKYFLLLFLGMVMIISLKQR